MFDNAELNEKYPTLSQYADPLRVPKREIIGREAEKNQLLAAMSRPELSNVILLAEAGVGKTALVQTTSQTDTEHLYLEVSLSKMTSDVPNSEAMAGAVKTLFDEAESFVRGEGEQLVMFMDEFHLLVQLSPAAVEAVKPVLAQSGFRGIRIIAATTYEEFDTYIAPNQPLVERLPRISLSSTDEATTIKILDGMATEHGVRHLFDAQGRMFRRIYDLTNRYMMASAQPRKSVLVLDAMIGWNKQFATPMNNDLLARVLRDSLNIEITFQADASRIKEEMDERVYAQGLATGVVSRRLQLCVADMHDKSRPMSSFLFTGSTGVGKTELTKLLAEKLFGSASRHLVRFDMSEYASESAVDRFRSDISKAAWNVGHGVLLLDEIEKASKPVIQVLLQVLDDGRLTNDHGKQVSFLNFYIVLTTNKGASIYNKIGRYMLRDRPVDETGVTVQQENNDLDDTEARQERQEIEDFDKTQDGRALGKSLSGIDQDAVTSDDIRLLQSKLPLIKKALISTSGGKFTPEFMGRIDAVVPFMTLRRQDLNRIVMAKLRSMGMDLYAKHGVSAHVDKRVVDYLVENEADTDSDAGGARDIVSRLTNEVFTEVAAYINENTRDKYIDIYVDGILPSEDKTRRVSDAQVRVASSQSRR